MSVFFATYVTPVLMGLGIISTGCFVVLALLYWRREKSASVRLSQAKTEVADMTMLFQTMRDVVGQQKQLAKQFNEELDQKVNAVKQILSQALEKNQKLYERQEALGMQLDEVQAQLEGLQRQAADLRTNPKPAQPAAEPRPRPAAPPPPADPMAHDRGERERLSGTGVTKASFSQWEGADFTLQPDAADPDPTPPAAPPPAAPQNAEAARQAFRALLNIQSEPAPPTAPEAPPSGATPEAANAGNAGSNGAASGVSLQQRALEYSEAGMSVAEIARELGIGKGEVRLMLSLAKQRRS